MRLTYLVANAAYVFAWHGQLIRMGDGPMFHESRRDAVSAAERCGLSVSRAGVVGAAA